MDVAASGAAQGATPIKTAAGDRMISGDFETFLKMLTTQMENQDPLNPIKSAEYATQLATFSGVEQQVRTNDLLQGLSDRMGATNLAQLAGWVGMEARSAAPVAFEGTPVSLSPDVAEGADRAELVVHDANGEEAQRVDLPLGENRVAWSGVDESGAPFPSGSYTFTVESFEEGAVVDTRPAQAYAAITEAREAEDGVMLVLEGGSEIPAADVTALRGAGTG